MLLKNIHCCLLRVRDMLSVSISFFASIASIDTML